MSSRDVPDQDAGFGLIRAFEKLRGVSDRSMADRAREAQRAARQQAKAELGEAPHVIETRTIVHQDALEAWPLPGLAPMTRVRTSFGDVPAAALRKGDDVLTRSGYRRILWLNRIHLDAHILTTKPDSNPIQIRSGALGGRLPAKDIMVSPRQIIVADESNGLSRDREASMLLSRQGVRRLMESSLSYTMLHVGESADIWCEGLFLRFPIEH
jgi:hypothetical protein